MLKTHGGPAGSSARRSVMARLKCSVRDGQAAKGPRTAALCAYTSHSKGGVVAFSEGPKLLPFYKNLAKGQLLP
jgi:hypothetical protein